MKKKKILRVIIYSVGIALIAAGLYGYSEYNRKVKDLRTVKADVQITADDFIEAFQKNESKGNASYLDKIIEIKGVVKNIEKNSSGYFSLVLGDGNSMSSVRCSMDTLYQHEISKIKEGELVEIKGSCTGFRSDDLLGSDVILNRCVLVK